MNRCTKVKDNFVKKRNVLISAAVLAAFCAMFILVLLLNINKAQAVEVTINTDYTIDSDDLNITLEVVSNGTYVIDGESILRNNVTIDVVPNSDSVNNVQLVLKNVRIQSSIDSPIIQFNAANSSSVCNYTLAIEGDCLLEHTLEGSKSALISVQSVSASVIKLAEYVSTARYTRLSDLLTESEVVYASSLKITNNTAGAATSGVLTLITGRNSYGAAIGSGEANLDVDVNLSEGNPNIIFQPEYLLKEDGTPYDTLQNAFDYLNEKYGTSYASDTQLPVGKEFFVSSTLNAGNVTIDGNVEINIKGQGYGAGIGGGGSESAAVTSGRAGIVTINAGTVAINMTSNAPCIGCGLNSAGGKNANGNNIIVSGGSLYMNAVGNKYIGNLQNANGQKLYFFEVDLTADGNRGFSVEAWNADIDISDSKYTNNYVVNADVNNELATVVLNDGSYSYLGYGHKNISNVGINQSIVANKLYFYLPATPTAELTILPESYINATQRIEIYQNNTYISPITRDKYVLAADQYVDVKIYDVPESIDVANVTVDGKTYPVNEANDANGDYYIVSFKMPETSTELKVNYAGNIDIVYNDGFSDTDLSDNNHGYVAPNSLIYTFGNDMVLPVPAVSDLVFDGWYVTGTDRKITTITSADILAGDILTEGKINLTAKWKCTVTYIYSYDEGTDEIIRKDEHTYGDAFTLNPSDASLPVPPSLEYYDFIGWNVASDIYSVENGRVYYENALTNNLTIRAEYKKNRYYVYVDTAFFNATNVELLMGSQALTFEEQTYTEDGKTYKRTLVTEAVPTVALNISAKQGYQISPVNWSVSIRNAASVTDNWNDNSVTYQVGLDNNDIYIVNNNCEFIPKEYTITFYDGIDDTPWKVVNYTVETMEFPKSITDILGSDAININTRYDRYHKFIGWKANTAIAPTDPVVTEINNLGNYIFVAAWEEAEKHPIDITVYDEATNEIADYVAAVPYLYDINYGSKAPIEITEVYDEEAGITRNVIYVIPGDNIYFEFVAIDSNGNFITDGAGNYKVIDIGKGISFADLGEAPDDYTIRYKYESKALEETTKKNRSDKRYITIPDDVNEGAEVNVEIRIALSRFTIQYWDLRGYETANPKTYTIFDEFEFEPLLDDVGWELVMSDKDDTNYDDVTTTPITGISKWSSGNLILKAAWPSGYTGLYNIKVLVDGDAKGTVEILTPAENGYKETQSVLVNVQVQDGYKLKPNSLVYKTVEKNSEQTLLAMRTRTLNLPMVISPVNEELGLYLFMMPGSDIEITAEFETEVYSIIFNEIDDNVVNTNPSSYTVEDRILLEDPIRAGYSFKGWKDSAGNIITEIAERTGDIELTPVWEADAEETTINSINETENTTDNTIESTTENSNNGGGEEETTTKKQFIGGNSNSGGNGSFDGGDYVQTGDNTNTAKLIVILVVAAVLLIFVVIKSKKNDENKDDKEEKEKLK